MGGTCISWRSSYQSWPYKIGISSARRSSQRLAARLVAARAHPRNASKLVGMIAERDDSTLHPGRLGSVPPQIMTRIGMGGLTVRNPRVDDRAAPTPARWNSPG